MEVIVDTTELAPYGDRCGTPRPSEPVTSEDRSGAEQHPARFPLPGTPPAQLLALMDELEDVGRAFEQLFRSLVTVGSLPPRIRELVVLRVAWACKNSYIWGGHVLIAETEGLRLVDRGSQPELASRPWQPDELLVLVATDELVFNGRLTTARRKRLLEIMTRRQVLEMTVVVGSYRAIAILSEVADFTREPGKPALPSAWPSVAADPTPLPAS